MQELRIKDLIGILQYTLNEYGNIPVLFQSPSNPGASLSALGYVYKTYCPDTTPSELIINLGRK